MIFDMSGISFAVLAKNIIFVHDRFLSKFSYITIFQFKVTMVEDFIFKTHSYPSL